MRGGLKSRMWGIGPPSGYRPEKINCCYEREIQKEV